MIKAIETRYKGYRFRSRLEARWAVFFDALGLEWEYEPEGFDLGPAGWYLPDFRVFQKINGENEGTPVYVEIKGRGAFSASMVEKSVYMAGKISPDCDDSMHDSWRESIADKEFMGHKHEFYSEGRADEDPMTFKRGYVYSGPHFSDNHGCYIVHERAFRQIERCDFVFAWIGANNAYGTLVEIGYAHSIGKPIYLGFGPEADHKDMWFAEECSVASGVFATASDAWAGLIEKTKIAKPSGDEEKKISELSKHLGTVYLFSGDPLDHASWAYVGGYVSKRIALAPIYRLLGAWSFDEVRIAAQEARAARFEHGETP